MTSFITNKARAVTAPFFVAVLAVLLPACAGTDRIASSPQISKYDQLTEKEVAFQAELEEMDFLTLVEKQMELEAYMTIDEKTKIVTFDTERAKQAGHEASIIALADEMMSYQNQMMRKMKADGISDVTQVEVPIEPFPLAQMFQERARTNAEKARVDKSLPD